TPPRQLNPQVPAVVENALLKALSKQRAERYPSVAAFIAALNNQAPASTVLGEQRDKEQLGEDTTKRAERYPSVATFMAALNDQAPTVTALGEQRDKDQLGRDTTLGRNVDRRENWRKRLSTFPARNSNMRVAMIVLLVVLILLLLGGGL